MQNIIQKRIRSFQRAANSQQTAEAGFTLIEVLVSLTIFSIAVAGVITVAVQGNMNIHASQNRMTAQYLADEQIELMRGLRDTYVVQAGVGSETVGWSNFVTEVPGTSTCVASDPCDIDPTNYYGSDPFPTSANIAGCGAGGGFCQLYYIPATGYYSSNTGIYSGTLPASPWSRHMILDTSVPNEVKVTVTIKWLEGSVMQTLTETETLYNWYV